MNNLFVCHTPYQVLVTVVITQMYPDDQNRVVLSRDVADYERLYDNLKKSRCFHDCFLLPFKSIEWCVFKNRFKNITNRSLRVVFEKAGQLDITEQVDRLFISNITGFNPIFADFIFNRNPNAELYAYEDGLITISDYNRMVYDKAIRTKEPMRKLYNLFFPSPLKKLNSYLVFNSEYMNWRPECPVITLPAIDDYPEHCAAVRRILNICWNYREEYNEYQTDYIFFEESYFASGIEIGDAEVIRKTAETVGKKNLTVKLHPRNPVNRFQNDGIRTNRITFIPWELQALNMDLSSKTLITIASGAVTSLLLNIKKKPKKVIILLNCMDDTKLYPSAEVARRVCEKIPDVYMPASLTEYYQFLSGQAGRKDMESPVPRKEKKT